MEIAPRPARRISRSARIDMLGRVADRAPALRLQRAALLIKLMRLDEAEVELAFAFEGDEAHRATLLQIEILTLRGDPASAAQAAALLDAIAIRTSDPCERQSLIVRRASRLAGAGDAATARAMAWDVLAGPEVDVGAISLLFKIGLSGEEARTLLARFGALMAGDDAPPRAFALHKALLARTGDIDAARQLSGFDDYLAWSRLFDEDDPLNAAIAAEIRAADDLHYSAGRRPGRHLWRLEGLPTRGMISVPTLFEAIIKAVKTYTDALPEGEHPFLRSRPANARLSAWAAIASEQGAEDWHIHDKAWLSGTYYVAMPPVADDDGGAIAFGWPGGEDQASAAEGITLTKRLPKAGELLLFPGYQFHRTVPLGQAGERIAITFDIMPV